MPLFRVLNLRFPGIAVGVLAAFLLLLAAGCSDDSTRPEEEDPVVTDPVISGALMRTTGLGDGTQLQDQADVWIDDEALGLIAAMSLAGQTDDEAEAGDGGWNFTLLPELDQQLFTPGNAVTIEMLGAAGGTQTHLVFTTPAAQLDIVLPIRDASTSIDGFNLVWNGGGADAIVFIELSSNVQEHSWSVTTENDGIYTLDSSDLEGFPRGSCTIRVEASSRTALTSVDLGVGPMDLVMASETVIQLSQ